MTNEALIQKAIEAKEKAYTPYSNFRVGAALLAKDGTVYTGANIEIASYSPTLCAERNALFTAVHAGEREFVKIVVTADAADTFPCGVCRQALREFGTQIEIIIANSPEDYTVYTQEELLPHSFGPEDLNK